MPDRFYDWKYQIKTVRRLLASRREGAAELLKMEDGHTSGLRAWSFELAPIYISQASGGSTGSVELGWAPHWFLSRRAFLAGLVGISFLQGEDGNPFLALNTQLFLSYFLFSRVTVGAGGGAETWNGNGGTRPALGAVVTLRLHSRDEAAFLDRIFVNYAKILATNSSDVWRAGFGFLF